MFVTLATGLGREGISGEIYFRRKSSIKPRPHFTHNLTKPCHAPSRPQHTLTSADMPKNRDRRGPKIIGKNLNPNKPISIVLCSVYMLGVDPSKLQGLGSDSADEDNREERATATLAVRTLCAIDEGEECTLDYGRAYGARGYASKWS